VPGVDDRTRAIESIAALARQHQISAAEIAAAIGASPAQQSSNRRRDVLVKVLAYLGGIFVFAGVGVFIALQWSSMNSAARITVTLGSGVAAVVLALLAVREERFEKAATPLFLIAAALEPAGMLVTFDELGSGGDWRWAGLITSGAMALQFGGVFAAFRRSTPLFLLLVFGVLFWGTAFDLLDVDGDLIALVLGAAMLLAAIGIDRSPHRVITPFWYFVGDAAFLYGLFDAVRETPLEILFLAAAAGLIYMSAALHSRTLLFVTTAAIFGYTGWFTAEHFANSVGWPLALIAFGLFMIVLSALAFRFDRQYVQHRG
jgi:hypothetical protein